MRRWFHHHLPHYFAKHLSLGLEELYILVGLNDLALSAVMIFEPIYLYGLGLPLARIALFYFFIYFGYTFLVPLGGMVTSRIGYPRAILLGSICLVVYYFSLFSIAFSGAFYWVAIVAFAVQKSLYWPAFESDFVRYAHQKQQGKELSGILSLSTFVNVIGPFLGGLVIKLYGFPALFGLVIGLILTSNLPLFFSKNPASREPVKYWSAWGFLLQPKRRPALVAYLGFAEELIVLVFWPIAMFLVVKNFAGLGSLVALATLVTASLTLYIGKLTDQHRQSSLIRFGSSATAITWLARFAAVTPLLAFVVDTASRLFKSMVYVPLLELTFARGPKDGPIRTTVFYEQSLAIGKMFTALAFVIIFSFTTNLWVAFPVAAAASLLYRSIVRNAH